MKPEILEEASRLFQDYNCTQAIITACSDELEIDKDMALKIGSCFGGGMGAEEVCGCVTGALMVIGLKYGRCRVDEVEKQIKSKELCKVFQEKFKKEHGSCICRELKAEAEGNPEEVLCPLLVRSAASIVYDIFNEQ